MASKTKKRAAAIRRRFGEDDLPDEPKWDVMVSDPADMRLAKALNYYNQVFLNNKKTVYRDWLVKYAEASPDITRDEVKVIRRMEEWRLTNSICSISRLLLNGCLLSPDIVASHVARIKSEVGGYVLNEAPKKDRPKPGVVSSQVRARILGYFEESYDAFINSGYETPFSAYELLTELQTPKAAAKEVGDYYRRWADEMALIKTDPDVREAYSHLKRPTINRIVEQLSSIVKDTDRYVGNLKAAVVRKPRKIREKSASDQVKKVHYLKAHPALQLVSVDPASMVGAKVIILYSTKYKVLRRLQGDSMTVKGSTVHGFDEAKSQAKTLRKPEEVLAKVLAKGASTANVRKVMEELTTKPSTVTGRINEDTVILRTFR